MLTPILIEKIRVIGFYRSLDNLSQFFVEH